MTTNNMFENRRAAGKALASALLQYQGRKDTLVLALPRGGVPVAYEIATALNLPLDVLVVRKLGVPGHDELAFGAMTHNNVTFLNKGIIEELNISAAMQQQVIARESKEVARREATYRGNLPFPDLADKTIILVDDGIATGASMRVAIAVLKKLNVAQIVVAVPVADFTLSKQLALEVDHYVCLLQPQQFYAVGNWYIDFAQTEDDEVRVLLEKACK